MDPVITTIAINVLSNFVTDALRWKKGEPAPRIAEVIESTELSFPEMDGLSNTLMQWFSAAQVINVLQAYIEGHLGADQLPIDDLVKTLLTKTQFYLPEHSKATAEKIISTFVSKLRAAYLADTQSGILYIANRTEAHSSQQRTQLTAIEQKVESLSAQVMSAGGLRPSLQTHFETALATFDRGNYPAANALFETLLQEVRVAPIRDMELERQIYVKLANIASGLGEYRGAIGYYKKAAEIDTDATRGAVNGAIADLLDLKSAEALRRLDAVETPPTSSNYEYWSAKVNVLVRLDRFEEAIRIALSITVQTRRPSDFSSSGSRIYMRGTCRRRKKRSAAPSRSMPIGPSRIFCLARRCSSLSENTIRSTKRKDFYPNSGPRSMRQLCIWSLVLAR